MKKTTGVFAEELHPQKLDDLQKKRRRWRAASCSLRSSCRKFKARLGLILHFQAEGTKNLGFLSRKASTK